jgi:hypothetical protein
MGGVFIFPDSTTARMMFVCLLVKDIFRGGLEPRGLTGKVYGTIALIRCGRFAERVEDPNL